MRNKFLIYTTLFTLGQGYACFQGLLPLWTFLLTLPFIIIIYSDCFQVKRTIMFNFPLLGRLRYVMESLRPKIYQYFVESDVDGTPINRIYRSVIYQRAKKELQSTPFGTQLDVYAEGYEWINHSLNPLSFEREHFREKVGGKDCKKPYSCSLLNISAMSFGSLSPNAILALNGGAKKGSFAHNTGEGGISPYHLKHGGDLIWQIGTGYFGCRDSQGHFSPEMFAQKATIDNVKMIEIKLSQGAKPGHGGILPASKNNPEIAKIRGVEAYTRVVSPPKHSAFSSNLELIHFIKQLRDLSQGKPIGIKLCIGIKEEVVNLLMSMKESDIFPDFIVVDGSEGGTGAAPLEFANSIGTPLYDGLSFLDQTMKDLGIRDEVKILASGKIMTGFEMVKAIALGADICYSARAMMLALGCIQALECNKNSCPAGVATQKKSLYQGLSVTHKLERVYNFQHGTLESFGEIISAAGLSDPKELKKEHVYRRIDPTIVKSFAEIYTG